MMKKSKNSEKTTNEKPVSLYPLGFREAVAALLKVKPKPPKGDERANEKTDAKPAMRQE